jgi:isopentenyldiphosphate isomerase
MNEDEEILDLVDDQDNVIGQVPRKLFADPSHIPDGNMRAAEVFLVNKNGELWVPRRSLHKKQWPGGFDFSAAEHVQAGETYPDAMVRGLQEELNMAVAQEDLELLGKLKPEPGIPIHRTIYRLRWEEQPQFNPDDILDAAWLRPAELLRRIKAGEPTKSTVPSAVITYFGGNNENNS